MSSYLPLELHERCDPTVLRARMVRQKRFVFTLTFDVTPSNNVQAAFGAD